LVEKKQGDHRALRGSERGEAKLGGQPCNIGMRWGKRERFPKKEKIGEGFKKTNCVQWERPEKAGRRLLLQGEKSVEKEKKKNNLQTRTKDINGGVWWDIPCKRGKTLQKRMRHSGRVESSLPSSKNGGGTLVWKRGVGVKRPMQGPWTKGEG